MAASAHRSTSTSMALSLFLLTTIAFSSVTAQSPSSPSCASHTFSSSQLYGSCATLPHLGTTLHYNYTAAGNTVSVAFRAPSKGGGWVAWGLNPNGTGMVGTQAVVAFRHSNGSLVAYPTVLDSYAPSMAPADAAELGFPVSDVAAEYAKKGGEMVVYATVALPGKGSKFNHVWQQGSSVVNDVPAAHPTTGDNILSTGAIDFSK
ncbi:cytochrome b561 and DOMON domain-containing protein At5g47530 [Lolium perenne]|uniref:cytochrome b561 and DOMON domain-containing protein At5g47530 n=1 Tax=Lolium perenne TaxID=4522 RepID=UPI0021EA6B45|nr:cytochrome b561 and DOMON domain-containing protein At5g47530-like [Lolium perenne]